MDLAVDAVRDVPSGHTVVVGVGVSSREERPRLAPVKLRHASFEVIERCIKPFEDAWPPRVLIGVVGPMDTLRERVGALVALGMWREHLRRTDREPVERVFVSRSLGLAGDGAGEIEPLLGLEESRRIVARVVHDIETIQGDVVPTPEVHVVPYGLAATSVASVGARALGVRAASNQWPVSAPPSSFVTSLGDLARVARDGDLLSVANMLVRMNREPGAELVREDLRAAAIDRVTRALLDMPGAAPARLRALAHHARGILEGRSGDYEAIDMALSAVCDHDGTSVARVTPIVVDMLGDDPYAVTLAMVCRAHVANHRGDLGPADKALAAARAHADRERSLRMALLDLEIVTLDAVQCQNRWPFRTKPQGKLPEIAEALEKAIAARVHLLPAAGGATPLYRDPTIGAALGTLGRTRAYLGEHEAAAEALEQARLHFSSDLDLRVNANYLALVELDQPSGARPDRLVSHLGRCVSETDRSAEAARSALARGDLGRRFTMDLLLRCLLWGPAIPGLDREEWRVALEARGASSLHGLLSACLTHPTELCARHAGELLGEAGRRDASEAPWLALALSVKGGPTLGALEVFTQRLLEDDDPVDSDRPRGHHHNPAFDHR